MAKIAEVTSHRVYVTTVFGEPVVTALKDLGAKWEAETKRWWIGKKKLAQVTKLVEGGPASEKALIEKKAVNAAYFKEVLSKGLKVQGNSFDVKDQIKELGGVWHQDTKGWYMPNPESLAKIHAVIKPKKIDSKKPEVLLASVPAHKTGTNKKPDNCEMCGAWIEAGLGQLLFCVEDSGCMKHHDFSGYHVHCLNTDECKVRREAAKEAKKKANEAKFEAAKKEAALKDAREQDYKRIKEFHTQGLEKTCAGLQTPGSYVLQMVLADNAASFPRATFSKGTVDGGVVVFRETLDIGDDYRVYFYGKPELIKAWRLMWAKKNNITVEVAKEWLEKYNGCEGTDLYTEVLKAAGP